MSSWRRLCLHDSLDSPAVVDQPTTVLFLDNLSLPYADETPTTTPVEPPPPPTTSGRHISISGQTEWSVDAATSTDTGSCGGGLATPASDVTPSPTSEIDDESRDRVGSCGQVGSYGQVGSRDRVGSLVSTIRSLPAPAESGSDAAAASMPEPSPPVYRATNIAADTFRRCEPTQFRPDCEPTHFHWTSTSTSASARPRPSLRPAAVDSMIISSLVSSPGGSAHWT